MNGRDYQGAYRILADLQRATHDPGFMAGMLAAHHAAGRGDLAACARRAIAELQAHTTGGVR